VRAMDCRDSWRGDAEESFRPPAPFRRGIPRARLHVAFCFQPIESGIDGADRNFSLRANLDLAANGDAVGLVIQTQNREKHDVFEFAKIVAVGHYLYNIEEIDLRQARKTRKTLVESGPQIDRAILVDGVRKGEESIICLLAGANLRTSVA